MIRKHVWRLVGVLFLAVWAFSCADSEPDDRSRGEQPLKVVATLFPNYDFARAVGGEQVDVTLLLPPGVEPHSYEPTPRDILAIRQADVFLYTGAAMEPWVDDLLAGIDKPGQRVVDLSAGLAAHEKAGSSITEPHHPEQDRHGDAKGHDGHHDHGIDPHIWLDLAYAREMVDRITAAFKQEDPAHAEQYERRAEKYKASLKQLDDDIAEVVRHSRQKRIIHGGHFAFGRFAERYGLTHISPYRGFSPDAEPSPQAIAALIRELNDTKVKYIFYEAMVDPRVADVIAEQTDAQLLPLHPAGNLTREERKAGETFLSIMRRNLENLKLGLGYEAGDAQTEGPVGHDHH